MYEYILGDICVWVCVVVDASKLTSQFAVKQVDAAIALAAEKYCGVHGTLSGAAKITFGSEIVEVE